MKKALIAFTAFILSTAFVPLVAETALSGSLDSLSPSGRYALDEKSCKAKDYFATLTATMIILPTYTCKGVDYDRTEKKGGRAVFAVRAKSCVGEETAKPASDAFSLTLEDDILQFTWKDGSQSAKLRRCPAH